MHFLKNKIAAIAIAIFLIVSMGASMLLIPNTSAHNPPWTIEDHAYVAVQPNPTGLGQTVYISIWTAQPMPNSAETNNIRKDNYALIITAPDGTNTTQNWAIVDNTGGELTTSFTPTQVGTYTATFNYGGQTYPTLSQVTSSVALAAATVASINAYAGDVYLPGNASTTFTVQQDALAAPINSYPLPTDYWTHPIEGQNTYWYTISTNWLSSAYLGTFQQGAMNLWQQNGVAPSSAHIMWTKPIEFGGVTGGLNTGVNGASYYSGSSYEGRFYNAIVMNGYLYYKMPESDATTAGGSGNTYVNAGPYVCVDLRTGKTIWQNQNINPTFGQLLNFINPNQSGTIPSGYLIQPVTVGTTATWIYYNGFDGAWIFNITNIPSVAITTYGKNGYIAAAQTATTVYDSMGNIDLYVLNYNNTAKAGWLALWNMTDAVSGGGVTADLSTGWRPVGTIIDGSKSTAYEWNMTISANLGGPAINSTDATGVSPGAPTPYAILPGDVLFGTSSSLLSSVGAQYTPNPFTMWALNLNASKGTVGQLMWIQNYTAPQIMTGNTNLGSYTQRLGPVDPTNRVITMYNVETMDWYGYSLDNGNLLWGPTTTEINGYQFFGSGSGGGQWAVDAYGKIYIQGYGGVIYTYDTANGNLLWTFGNGGAGNSTNDGLNSPWGLLPIFIAGIQDGKVYAFTNQHGNGAQSPYYKGEMIYCLNATTGEQIWSMMGMAGQNGGAGASTSLLADGFLAYYNYYDNQIYSVGKGPSQLTVNVPNPVTEVGSPIVISGTVMDISAGTKQDQQAADFPNGVPAVSDASQSAWMQYVYMQKPKPTDAIGVPVTLSVIDSNGNLRQIGTTTSDTSGMFTYTWMPDIQGDYKAIATFAGSQSYWGSSSETSFYSSAVHATPTPTTSQTNLATTTDLMTYIAVGVIAIIIAIAIVGLLILRKRP
jgi:hypothetical protein